MTNKPMMPLIELQMKALQTALQYVIYSGYQKSETKALAALKRRCPGRSKEECLKWLHLAEAAFRDSVTYIEENKNEAFRIYNNDTSNVNLLPMAKPYVETYSMFPKEHLRWVLNMVLLNYHLR